MEVGFAEIEFDGDIGDNLEVDVDGSESFLSEEIPLEFEEGIAVEVLGVEVMDVDEVSSLTDGKGKAEPELIVFEPIELLPLLSLPPDWIIGV